MTLTLPTPGGGEADIEVTAMNLGLGLSITAVRPPGLPPAPVASFTGTPTTGTDPVNVTFTDASTNTPTSWLWERNSGGGWSTFSTSQNPTQSFTAGTWSVRLTATNASGSHTYTRTNYLTVAAAGIALVSHTAKGGSANGVTSDPIDTTGANLFVVYGSGWANAASPPGTPSDSRGLTWTRLDTGFGDGYATMWYAVGTGGAGHTFTLSGTNLYPSISASAWSGAAASPLGQQGHSNSTGGPGTLTPATDGELVIFGATCGNSGQTPGTPTAGFTTLDTVTGGSGSSNFGVGVAYQIQTTATARTPTFSTATGGSGATFKKA